MGPDREPGIPLTAPLLPSTCAGGRWQCRDLPCPATCSVQGGTHVSTFDGKLYDLHGDCTYVLTKVRGARGLQKAAEGRGRGRAAGRGPAWPGVPLSPASPSDTRLPQRCGGGSFSVLAELRQCGLTDTETCLKAVTLSLDGGDTVSPDAQGRGAWDRARGGRPTPSDRPAPTRRPSGSRPTAPCS